MVIVGTETVLQSLELNKTLKIKFEWKIENPVIPSNVQESIDFPDGRKFILECRFVQDGQVTPFFKLEPETNHRSLQVNKVSMVLIQNIKSGTRYEYLDDLDDSFIGPTEFIASSSLDSNLDDGFFILCVEVDIQVKHPLSDLGRSLEDPKEKLLNDLDSIMVKEKVSDFTYRVNDREFPVHKMMLAARSPVFMEMFSTEFKTSAKGVIDDISEEAFEDFLRFIYTGKVEIVMKHAKELLMISDKYEVKDLKALCELYLLANLNADVAVDVFQCAHKCHSEIDLKKAAFEHIKTSFAKWNLDLPNDFINAPKAINRIIMMKTNLENEMKAEIAQAENVKFAKVLETSYCLKEID